MLPEIALPALVALVFKLLLLAYSARFPSKSPVTRWFVALLAVLALHNIAEVLLLYYFVHHGLTRVVAAYGYAYIAFLIVAIAQILDISLRLSFDAKSGTVHERLRPLIYLPSAALLFMLLFTDQLVPGFQPFKNTVLRIAGPYYFLFETYLLLYFQMALFYLIYGSRSARTSALRRARSRLWLIGIAPMVLLLDYLIIANHFGVAKISSTIYLPVALTYFLIVTTYATHQYRLFDIEFFLPWSKVRKRKTVFYKRIQATVAELADLRSVDEALSRVSGILLCPTALIGRSGPVLALAGEGAVEMAQFPDEQLKQVEHIVVSNEIAEALPELHRFMQKHHVAAIVPFYLRSETAASWLLLGDSFSDSVYTPLDFKNVERLFDSLGEFFLDKLAYLRTELGQAEKHARDTHERLQRLERELVALREEQTQLHDSRLRLVRENRTLQQALDPGSADHAPELNPASSTQRELKHSLESQIATFEEQLIRETLTSHHGSIPAAARILGMDPVVLCDKANRYGLPIRTDE